jgi:Mn-dependent DtxR family transcriptional regulator
MDDVDRAILKALDTHRTPSLREVARQIGVSRQTVLNRARSMKEQDPPLVDIEYGARGLSLTDAGRIAMTKGLLP